MFTLGFIYKGSLSGVRGSLSSEGNDTLAYLPTNTLIEENLPQSEGRRGMNGRIVMNAMF